MNGANGIPVAASAPDTAAARPERFLLKVSGMSQARASTALLVATLAILAGCGGSPKGTGRETSGATTDGGSGFLPPTSPPNSGAGSPPSLGATDSGSSTATKDAGAAADTSPPPPSQTYPAFTPDVAQVLANGGAVLKAPVIVTITWSSDPSAPMYEAFGDSIGASNYWKAINSEYGVGPAVSGSSNHVTISTPPPSSIADTDITTLVGTNAGSAADWPAPSSQTLYAFYLPPGTSLTSGGQDLCAQGVGGYHDQTTAADGSTVSYAVMPLCPMFTPQDSIAAASHEFDEAATDPLPGTALAYAGFDPNHLSYEFMNSFQDELGDACEMYQSSYYTDSEPGFTYPVQRQWSNKSAAAGHDPCVPVPSAPYFSVTLVPSEEDTITVDVSSLMLQTGSATVQTKGFKATLNQPRTFDIGFFSDAVTEPWTITASVDPQMPFGDATGNMVANGAATVTLSKTQGANGDKATVTVTPTAFSTYGVVYVYITSSLGQATHTTPILIGGS